MIIAVNIPEHLEAIHSHAQPNLGLAFARTAFPARIFSTGNLAEPLDYMAFDGTKEKLVLRLWNRIESNKTSPSTSLQLLERPSTLIQALTYPCSKPSTPHSRLPFLSGCSPRSITYLAPSLRIGRFLTVQHEFHRHRRHHPYRPRRRDSQVENEQDPARPQYAST